MSDEDGVLEKSEMFEPPEPNDRDLADLDLNDYGNGQRLIERHGRNLIHVTKIGWYAWDTTHWVQDEDAVKARILCHETTRAIANEARALENERPDCSGASSDKDIAKILANHSKLVTAHYKLARASGNSGKLKGMLREAQPYLSRLTSAMDTNTLLFNTPSGTLDLDALDAGVRPHDRADRITRIAGAPYDPEADAPRWRQFLAEILPDREIRNFLQRWFGYCLSGLTGEQKMVVAWGNGANGKSTVIRVMTRVMGSYAMPLAIESLLHNDRKRGGDASPDLAELPGARLVTASEPEIGARLSEAMVKTATGGETMTARQLYEKQITFDPNFKLMFSCNARPAIRGQDDGIWRRMLLVPFTVTIPQERQVSDMANKLFAAEAPGIFSWALDGWRLHSENGLAVPMAVSQATNEYRAESDPVGQFVATCLVKQPGRTVNATDLYKCYQAWCRSSAIDPLKQNPIGRLMNGRGFHSEKAGVEYYGDLALTPLGEELLNAHSEEQEPQTRHQD